MPPETAAGVPPQVSPAAVAATVPPGQVPPIVSVMVNPQLAANGQQLPPARIDPNGLPLPGTTQIDANGMPVVPLPDTNGQPLSPSAQLQFDQINQASRESRPRPSRRGAAAVGAAPCRSGGNGVDGSRTQ